MSGSSVPSFCDEETEAQSGVQIGLGVPWQVQAALAPSIQPAGLSAPVSSALWAPGRSSVQTWGLLGNRVWPTGQVRRLSPLGPCPGDSSPGVVVAAVLPGPCWPLRAAEGPSPALNSVPSHPQL